MLESDAFIWSLSGGALGGIISYMLIAYNRFETIPTIEEAEIAKKSLRKTYFVLRVTFGAVTAFMFSFWFMDDLMSKELSKSKFVFYSALIGFSTTLLPAVSSAFQKTLVSAISKLPS